jgi:hypothetical protein
MGASIFFTAAMPLGMDHCSSAEYRCTHVDVYVKNFNIVSICAV